MWRLIKTDLVYKAPQIFLIVLFILIFMIMMSIMNMKDPDGKTHHVMATFMRGDEKIEKAAGKVKLIAPSGKEQIADLKDYGGGNFAANFTIDEAGKWGVICLFKEDKGKHTVKFWYEHHQM